MNSFVFLFGQRQGLIEAIKRKGYGVILVDTESHPKADRFIPIDIHLASNSPDEIVLHPFQVKETIHAIIADNELLVEIASKVRSELYPYCKGLTREQAEYGRDKLATKRMAQAAKVPTARFQSMDASSFLEISKKMGLPFLIKPRKMVLARGIETICNENEWLNWQDKNKQHRDQFYIEELISIQKELSCDTVLSNGEVILQFPCEYTIDCLSSSRSHEGFAALFPAILPNETLKELKIMAQNIVKILGAKDGYFHLEFFLSNRGLLFGEVGARLAGGYHIPTESIICGIDLKNLYIDLFCDKNELNLETAKPCKASFVGYYLFPKKKGRVSKIRNELDTVSWIVNHTIEVQEGSYIEWEDASVARVGTAIFTGETVSEFMERLNNVPELLKINWET